MIIVAIQLPESPIPTTSTTTPTTSQKASSGYILGTKRGIIDPLVSKRPENFEEEKKVRKKISKELSKKNKKKNQIHPPKLKSKYSSLRL